MNKRRDLNRKALRDDLLNAAHQLYLEQGADFTVQELAHKVGIAKGSVYLVFPNKSELIEALLHRALDRLDQILANNTAPNARALDRLLGMGRAYITLYSEYPQEFALIRELDFLTPGLGWAQQGNTVLAQRAQAVKMQLLQHIQQGQIDGSIRTDINPNLVSLVVSQIVKSFIRSLALAEKSHDILSMTGFSAQQLIQELFELLKRALQQEVTCAGS